MRIYVYMSDKDAQILAFTADASGGNLPGKHGPWTLGTAPDVFAMGGEDDPVSAAIRRDGYFISGGQSIY